MKKKNKNKKVSEMKSSYDVLGSYTGTNSEDKYEKPIQDADDL